MLMSSGAFGNVAQRRTGVLNIALAALGCLTLGIAAKGQTPPPKTAPAPAKQPAPKTTQPSSASPADYSYELVADSAHPVSGHQFGKIVSVVMNDSGAIVYSAFLNPSGFGIFTPKEAIATTGARLPNGAIAKSLSYPSINKNGQVAFAASYDDPSCRCVVNGYFVDKDLVLAIEPETDAVFKGEFFSSWQRRQAEDGPYDATLPWDTSFEHHPIMAPDGKILLAINTVSRRVHPKPHGEPYVWGPTLNGVPVQPPTQNGVNFSVKGEDLTIRGNRVAINEAGDIVFFGYPRVPGMSSTGLYSTKRGRLSDLWMHQPHERLFVNNNGDVAFSASGREYYRGYPTTVVYADGRTKQLDGSLQGINDKGEVLSLRRGPAQPNGTRKGSYVFLDEKAIATLPIPSLSIPDDGVVNFMTAAVNARGEVAFVANESNHYRQAREDEDGTVVMTGWGKTFLVLARPNK